MQVPVRRQPQTQISEQQQGFEQAAPALNVEPLTHLIEGFRNQLLDEQDQRQRIGLNREILTEVNGMQEDFAQRQTDPTIPSIGFADSTNAAFEQRNAATIERLRGEGYHGEMLDDFANRLGTVRQGFFERGLLYQHTQLRAQAGAELSDITTQASQYAAIDPTHNYATARDTYQNSVRTHPDLTPEERVASEQQGLAIIRDGGMQAMRLQNPQMVVDVLDPHGLTAPTPPATAPLTNSETGAPIGPPAHMTAQQHETTSILYDQFRSHGMTDQGARTMVAQIGRENGFDPGLMFGTHTDHNNAESNMGMVSWQGPRRAAFMTYMQNHGFLNDGHLTQSPAALRAQADFADQEMQRLAPAAAAAVRDPNANYSTIEPVLSNQYFGWDRAGHHINAQQHLARMASYYEALSPASGSGADLQSFDPVTSSRAEAPVTGGSQLAPDVQPVDIPASSSPPGPTVPSPEALAHDISGIHTGNALIDDLNGRERMQLLGLAREQLNRTTASERAQMDVTRANITAEAMNNGGEIATPMPTEQAVLHAYPGPEGPQHWAELQAVHGVGQAMTAYRTQSATDIQRSLDVLRPAPGSPTYATQMEVYHHAQEAAHTLLDQREHDPAAYVMQYFPDVRTAAQSGNTPQYYAALDQAYQTLGINPATAPVMTAEQSREMATQYRTMSPDQRRQFMVQNWTMGEDRFRRFVHGMEGTSAEADANIFALLRSYPRGAGPSSIIFQDALIGRDTIAQDPARKPRAEDVIREFQAQGFSAIRDLNAGASRAIQDTAEGLYVQRGGNNNDGSFNPTRYRDALQTALGGNMPAAMGHGQAGQYYTILPPGVNQDQFHGWAGRQTLYSLSRAAGNHAPYYGDLRTPAQIQDIIDDGTYVMTSPGHYMIRMASDGRPLMARNGQPFLVNVDMRAVRSATPSRVNFWDRH